VGCFLEKPLAYTRGTRKRGSGPKIAEENKKKKSNPLRQKQKKRDTNRGRTT